MGDIAGSIIQKLITQSIKPPPDRVNKENEGVLNEVASIDNLAKAFSELQNKGTGVEKYFGQGRISGMLSKITGDLTGANPAVEPYEGQRKFVASALARIANPSGRGGTEMTKIFEDALPSAKSNWQEFASHITNAINDAFVKKSSVDGTPYNDIDANQLAKTILARHMPTEELKTFLKTSIAPKGPLPAMQFNRPLSQGSEAAPMDNLEGQ